MCSSNTILANILQVCSQAIPRDPVYPLSKSLQQYWWEGITRGFPMLSGTALKSLRNAELFVMM